MSIRVTNNSVLLFLGGGGLPCFSFKKQHALHKKFYEPLHFFHFMSKMPENINSFFVNKFCMTQYVAMWNCMH